MLLGRDVRAGVHGGDGVCLAALGAGDHLRLVSYIEGVENKADKANLEQCNLKLNYQDANEALLSFPPPNDCISLSRQFTLHRALVHHRLYSP